MKKSLVRFLTGDESFRILIKMNETGIFHESFDLYTQAGDHIHGDLRYRPAFIEKPVIVICHSFMAFKGWGFFPHAAEKFAGADYAAVTFNYSHDGVVGDGDRITDFKKFEKNTFSREVEETGVIIDAIWGGQLGAGVIDRSKIILLGHSRGGGIAILQAAKDERVRGLVSWSAVATFDRWTRHQKDLWRRAGHLALARDSTVSPLRLGIELLNDIEMHRNELDLSKAAERISVPWLILHGKEDGTVRCEEAVRLHTSSDRSATDLMIIDNVGHLYNAASRDEDNYKTINKIIHLTVDWLQRKIK